MSPLRVAVVGVGHLGKEHARIYAAIPGVRLVAVADLVRERAEAVAARTGAEAVGDHRSLLGKVDAVSVAVPTVGHFEIARAFLTAGVPCLVEKPMTKTTAEAKRLVALAAKHRTALQVGHVERFNPALRAIWPHVGRPRFIECHRLSPFRFRSMDIDVVMDLMIHDIDIVLHLVSSPLRRIDALGVGVLSGAEDIANARLTFADGCVANVTASRVSDKALRRTRIFSDDAYIAFDTGDRTAQVVRKAPGFNEALRDLPRDPTRIPDVKALLFEKYLRIENLQVSADEEPLRTELESFVEAVRTGSTPVVPGEHGLRAIETATRITRAIRTARARAESRRSRV
ncbi:MAG: Gfo/Idh/MocA family oxidoreductase [Planctomycetes bacterium]|nr:Gfo/Idh/MocA family oxidoreductase [Planctomycetota bacterium]